MLYMGLLGNYFYFVLFPFNYLVSYSCEINFFACLKMYSKTLQRNKFCYPNFLNPFSATFIQHFIYIYFRKFIVYYKYHIPPCKYYVFMKKNVFEKKSEIKCDRILNSLYAPWISITNNHPELYYLLFITLITLLIWSKMFYCLFTFAFAYAKSLWYFYLFGNLFSFSGFFYNTLFFCFNQYYKFILKLAYLLICIVFSSV